MAVSKRTVTLIGLIIAIPVVGFILIQLIPVWALQTNPPVVAEPNWDSPDTRVLAKRACFDCHSNETVWPLYSRIAPVSWLVTFDTIRARREMNFSEWVTARGEEGELSEEVAEVIEEGEMPPSNYLMMHPDSKLTEAEKQQLIRGLTASLGIGIP